MHNTLNIVEIEELLIKDIKKNNSIVLIAKCNIKYSGRAEAILNTGERIIIIKQDKSLLIHQPSGSTPVNYMKSDSSFTVLSNDSNLIIRTKNANELIELNIQEVYSYQSRHLEDTEKIQLIGTEKDMSDYIYKHPNIISKQFKPVSREEQTKFGFIDVFGYEKDKLVVVECKRYKAGPNAPQQLRRYIEKMAKSKGISPLKIKGILAAPDITKSARNMLKELGYEFKRVDLHELIFNKKTKKQSKILNFITKKAKNI